MSARALANLRRRLMRAFLMSSWDLRSREREGRLQEHLSNHAFHISTAVLGFGTLLGSLADRLDLPERFGAAVLPEITLVDLRTHNPGRNRWIADPLVLRGPWQEDFPGQVEELAMTLAAGLELGIY